MTRYIHTQLASPSNSVARKRKPANIPPFSFVGYLTAGNSHYYQPPSPIFLTGGSITAQTSGSSDAGILIMKKEPFIEQPIVIGGTILGQNDKKVLFSMEVSVSIYDHIFVGTFDSTAHSGVMIQLVGVEL